MNDTKNIYQRMNLIMKEAQSIEKLGWNDYSKYKYVRAVDVINEINNLCTKHGVQILINEETLDREKVDKNYFSKIKCKAIFVNVDTPTDQVEVGYFTISADTLDKDIFKAKTNGLKYLLTQVFLLVTDVIKDTEDDSTEASKPAPVAAPKPLSVPVFSVESYVAKFNACKNNSELTSAIATFKSDIKKMKIKLSEKETAFVKENIDFKKEQLGGAMGETK